MGGKWRRQVELTKTYPNGHEVKEVVALNPKSEHDLNPYFETDGEYYYWGEKMGTNLTCLYRPSIQRVGYGKMIARILPKTRHFEAVPISQVPPTPQQADLPFPCLVGSEK